MPRVNIEWSHSADTKTLKIMSPLNDDVVLKLEDIDFSEAVKLMKVIDKVIEELNK